MRAANLLVEEPYALMRARTDLWEPWRVIARATRPMSFSLDAAQRQQIEHRRQNTRNYRLAMRLSTLLWRDQGKTESEIAHLLGVCERTIRNWIRFYRQKRLEALCT